LSESQFQTISDALRIRQSQPVEGNRLDNICASIPTQRDEVQHVDILCRDVNTFFCEQQINLLLINNRGINTCKLITS